MYPGKKGRKKKMAKKLLSENERMKKILMGADACEECNLIEEEVGPLSDVEVIHANGTSTRRLCPNCRKGLGTQKANTA